MTLTLSISLGIVVGVFVLLFASVKMMWRVAEPNEALVISGLRHKSGEEDLGFKVVTGGGTFVIPGIQVVRSLDLGLREANLTTDCVTKQGIPVGIRGVAIFKIADDPVSIANAARRFLDQNDEAITRNIQNLFDGHLRSIIGGLTVEQLISERDSLTSEALKTAGTDMRKLGLIIDSLQIKDIADPTKYIANLAAPHVAEVTKNARIAQATADQEATQREQEAAAQKAQFTRDSETKRAAYQAEVDSAKATAAQAGPLAEAKAKQEVTVAETKTAELEANLAEQKLQATVRKPADAEAYSVKVKAEAERDANIALAAATQAAGEAEAAANKAKLLAEADGIRARAQALSENQEAVISQLLAEKMPEIVAQAASAYSKVGQVMMFEGAKGLTGGISEIVGIGATLLPMLRTAFQKKKKTDNG